MTLLLLVLLILMTEASQEVCPSRLARYLVCSALSMDYGVETGARNMAEFKGIKKDKLVGVVARNVG